MLYTDAHIHLDSLEKLDDFLASSQLINVAGVLSYTTNCSFFSDVKKRYPQKNIFVGTGIHPYNASFEEIEKFDHFIEKNYAHIDFIGEIGFDFTQKNWQIPQKIQEYVFSYQLDLAQKYGLPLVIHSCKGMHVILQYKEKLQKLTSLIFPGYSGSVQDAHSLLAVNPNSYFSFGTSLIKNHKKALISFCALPHDKILLETDGPFQVLDKNFQFNISLLEQIYAKATELLGISSEKLADSICKNFTQCFAQRSSKIFNRG